MQEGSIVSVQVADQSRQPMRSLQQAQAVSDFGLQGDRKASKGSARQVLFMDNETLQEFELRPGDVRENVTTAGLDLRAIQPGNVLFVGVEATFEVTGLCDPCRRMDDIRQGLRETLAGRRGVLTTVINGGLIQPGDTVRVEP